MRFLIFLFILFIATIQSLQAQNQAIYNFKIDSVIGGNKIDFERFKGKKILIISTASTDSAFERNYKELIQLNQIYHEKLIIIAVPTNSFNTEQGTNQQVAQRYIQTGKYKFPVTGRMNVNGAQINLLFRWLTTKTENTVADFDIKKPFYKYLINEHGKLIAAFNEKVNPMSEAIQKIVFK